VGRRGRSGSFALLIAWIAVLTLAPSAGAFVYWTNPSAGSIGRASITGAGMDVSFITGVPGACGLATSGDFLYWGNQQLGTVGRATLDGNGVDQSLIGGGAGTCGVSASGTSLAWANTNSIGIGTADATFVRQNWITGEPAVLMPQSTASHTAGGQDKVFWLNVDGSVWSTPFSTQSPSWLVVPCPACNGGGIAASAAGIFYIDTNFGAILHADLDGEHLSTLVSGLSGAPCGVAVDDTYVYWADEWRGSIGRALLNGSSPDPNWLTPPDGTVDPCWVAVDPDAASTSVSPDSIDFGDVLAGPGTPPQKSFTLTNSASTSVELALGTPSLSGPNVDQFLLSGDTCGPSVAPGASCGFSVDFDPTSIGGKSATLSIPSNDPDDNPIKIPISGNGIAPNETVSPSSISFATQLVDTVSAERTVTLTNGPGASAPDLVGQAALTGPNPDEFEIGSDGCSNATLPIGGTCQISVRYAPDAEGEAAASLSIPTDDSFAGPATVSLSGFGTDADEAVLPTSLAFGGQQVGQASGTQDITVANSADATGPLLVGSVSLGGASPSSYDLVSDQCSSQSVSPGDSCHLGIRFAPVGTGSQPAMVQVPSNGSDSPVGVTVGGTGVQPPAPGPAPVLNPSCHRLRVKLKHAKSKKRRRTIRKQLKRRGCR
jgi:hypothetical protein